MVPLPGAILPFFFLFPILGLKRGDILMMMHLCLTAHGRGLSWWPCCQKEKGILDISHFQNWTIWRRCGNVHLDQKYRRIEKSKNSISLGMFIKSSSM